MTMKVRKLKFEFLLNKTEYFHLLFLTSTFVVGLFFFDLQSKFQASFSLMLIAIIGGAYLFEPHTRRLSFLEQDCKERTNYEIIGPFGLVLITLWIAVIDFNNGEPVSKFTGLILLFTVFNLLFSYDEFKKRAERRLVTETSLSTHKTILICLGIGIYAIATRYFLISGVWEWNVVSPFYFLEALVSDDSLYLNFR